MNHPFLEQEEKTQHTDSYFPLLSPLKSSHQLTFVTPHVR